MKVRDLGMLSGQVLLFGGPYSNLQATQSLLVQADQRGICATNMICTGDVVAYCADPLDTVRALQRAGVAVVAGNVEEQLAAGADDCGCGFQSGTLCDQLSAAWYAHAAASVDDAIRNWMADLPNVITFEHAGKRCAVIHGGLSDVSRFLWPVSPEIEFTAEIALITQLLGPVNRVIAGHCGIGFTRQISGVEWINAGAIGMPANTGGTGGQYCVMTDNEIALVRLPYDHGAAHAAMQAAGLTQGYDAALVSGKWPSEDVLPEQMRRATS